MDIREAFSASSKSYIVHAEGKLKNKSFADALKYYKGTYAGASDKGAYFKFDSETAARAFVVNAHRNIKDVYADDPQLDDGSH